MYSILLIEDSEDSYNLVVRTLGSQYQITWGATYKEAMTLLRAKAWDMILLDVVLPDGDGFQIGSQIQADEKLRDIPLIFITSQATLSDKVLGLSIGADDYITKPFEPLELKARVESKIRKYEQRSHDSDVKRYGDIEINVASQKVYIFEEGKKQEVDLTPIEFKLLIHLSKDAHRVISREELLKSVWGENIHVFNRSVDTHVSKLRKKLGSKSGYIRSVHGTGYQFSAE